MDRLLTSSVSSGLTSVSDDSPRHQHPHLPAPPGGPWGQGWSQDHHEGQEGPAGRGQRLRWLLRARQQRGGQEGQPVLLGVRGVGRGLRGLPHSLYRAVSPLQGERDHTAPPGQEGSLCGEMSAPETARHD